MKYLVPPYPCQQLVLLVIEILVFFKKYVLSVSQFALRESFYCVIYIQKSAQIVYSCYFSHTEHTQEIARNEELENHQHCRSPMHACLLLATSTTISRISIILTPWILFGCFWASNKWNNILCSSFMSSFFDSTCLFWFIYIVACSRWFLHTVVYYYIIQIYCNLFILWVGILPDFSLGYYE